MMILIGWVTDPLLERFVSLVYGIFYGDSNPIVRIILWMMTSLAGKIIHTFDNTISINSAQVFKIEIQRNFFSIFDPARIETLIGFHSSISSNLHLDFLTKQNSGHLSLFLMFRLKNNYYVLY